MIIFTSNPSLIEYLPWNKPAVIYNLSSLYTGYKDATCLITNMKIVNFTTMPMNEYVETVDFDIQYANTILKTPVMFATFMDIIQCDYIGYNAIILVHRDFYRDAVMESLMKMIQQRYGVNSWIVEDPEDATNLKESYYTPEGIMLLNRDLEVYYELCKENVILNPVVDLNVTVE